MEQNSVFQRPMVVVVNEARQELITVINHYLRDEQIPCFILEPIVKELYTELKLNADKEYEQGLALVKQQEQARIQTENDKLKGEE